MKVLATITMLCVLSQPATAVTCDQVRSYVGTYGVAAALSYAKKIGATAEQIRDARSCLLRASKDQPRTGRTPEVFER
jgi:recombinational DNA repair protein RecR